MRKIYKTFSSPYHHLQHKASTKILKPSWSLKDEEFDVYSGSSHVFHSNCISSGKSLQGYFANRCQTPNPTVCLSSLKSDPRSAHSDIYGLAVIMIDVVKAKSTATQSKIKEVLKQHRGDKSLKDCAYSYRAVVEDDIPEAYEAIKLSRSMLALESMNDVVIEANSCTRAVSHFPPLPHLNKVVADVASVAAAIIDAFP